MHGKLAIAQTIIWEGNNSDDWHRPCNWNLNIVPTASHNVTIPNVSTNYPVITQNAHCRTLNITSTFSSALTVNVSGGGNLCKSSLNGGTCSTTLTQNPGCITNFIPNGSFENRTCCPPTNPITASMGCVDNWLNAIILNPPLFTGSSSDYLNVTCGHTTIASGSFPAPPSPPDGVGYIGYADMNIIKEWAGVCLTGPLTAGTAYTFTFKISASGTFTAPVTLFGTTNCGAIPSAVSPCSNASFVQLGTVNVSTNNSSWQNGVINFTAPSGIRGIIVGASCGAAPPGLPYFYLDDLALQ